MRIYNDIDRKIKKWESYIKRYKEPFECDVVRVKVWKITEFIKDLKEIKNATHKR